MIETLETLFSVILGAGVFFFGLYVIIKLIYKFIRW